MSTETEVCNGALGIAKQDATITSINENSVPAKRCKRFFVPLRRSLLQMFPWSFARRVKYLSLTEKESKAGFRYVYSYPSDALDILNVITQGGEYLEKDKYAIFVSSDLSTKEVHTNIEKAQVEITVDVDNVSLWSPLFEELFQSALAVKLSHIYKLSQSDMNDVIQNYQSAKMSAESSSSNEETRVFDDYNPYVEAR